MMNIETIQKNKLGTILRFSIPSIISSCCPRSSPLRTDTSQETMWEKMRWQPSIWACRFCIFYLGVGLCIGVGGSVLCGQLLGSQENRKASEVFSQSVATAFAVCVVTSLAVYLLFPTILRILQANGGLTLYFTQYYRVMLLN